MVSWGLKGAEGQIKHVIGPHLVTLKDAWYFIGELQSKKERFKDLLFEYHEAGFKVILRDHWLQKSYKCTLGVPRRP